MDANMACYPLLSSEIRDYYEKVSKGLIAERPYEYWGPDSVEEEAHWHQWWLPIKRPFRRIDWDSGFTGRGIVKHRKKAMERPGLVGPMGEKLVTDVDPLSGTIMWRIDSNLSFEVKVGERWKKRRSSSFEAASKMYKRVKKHFVAFIEVHPTTTSMRGSRSGTAIISLTEHNDKHHE